MDGDVLVVHVMVQVMSVKMRIETRKSVTLSQLVLLLSKTLLVISQVGVMLLESAQFNFHTVFSRQTFECYSLRCRQY